MKILVTGSAGFVGGYLVKELIENGHTVVGIDNYSKYGKVTREYDRDKNYFFTEGDIKDLELMKQLASDCDQIVALGAMVGGVSFFQRFAYDLIAENDEINSSTFNSAIWAFKNKKLKKINVISTSMVYENTALFPTPEGEQLRCPPPSTTYGFQKLSSEYYARAASKQYDLPYTIIRLYNCVGVGEFEPLYNKGFDTGSRKLILNHVVPDIIKKVLSGQDPLVIIGSGNQVRSYTHGSDLARGIRYCVEKKEAINEDFNLATSESTTVLKLAEMIWNKINKDKPFHYISETAFADDVQKSIPDTSKAQKLLSFKAEKTLSEILDEMIPWIIKQAEEEGKQ
jgi:nucleoside-diphosphate-sugar epimerase